MSSQSHRKTPWLLRFTYRGLKFKHMLGINMRLDEYSIRELVQTAEIAFWTKDEKWGDFLMEEAAIRIIEEHPPDGKRLEIEIEESAEEDVTSIKGRPCRYEVDDYSHRYW